MAEALTLVARALNLVKNVSGKSQWQGSALNPVARALNLVARALNLVTRALDLGSRVSGKIQL